MRASGLGLLATLIMLSGPVAASAEPAPGPARAAAAKTPPPFVAVRVIATDPILGARQRRLDAMVANAAARDVNGDAQDAYRDSLFSRNRCGSRACLNAWYANQEATLAKWDGGEDILAQPLK